MDIGTATQSVLRIFEEHRAVPGAPFEESHFLDFLLAEPKSARAVHNSFSGLRRYNAFIDAVQLHFAICFSVHDFEANYSLSTFVERVAQLQASRRSSLASFRNQQRHGYGWGSVLTISLFAVFVIVAASKLSQVLAAAIALLWSLVVGFCALHFVRWRSYQRRLKALLQERACIDA